MSSVKEEIKKTAGKHKERLQEHINIEAQCLLDIYTHGMITRLKGMARRFAIY